MQHPILTSHPGGRDAVEGAAKVTGESVLNEVYDLIRHRLPHLQPDDPARPYLAALGPALGEALGRPRAVAVPEARLRDAGHRPTA